MNQRSGTSAAWDVNTGIACLWCPAWCSSDIRNAVLASMASHDRVAMPADDAKAIQNTRVHAFSPIGHVLAVAVPEGVRICDFDLGTSNTHSCRDAQCLTFSPDGHKLAVATHDTVLIIELKEGKQTDLLKHPDKVASMAWAGNRIALGDFAGEITLWNPAEGEATSRIDVPGPSYARRNRLILGLVVWMISVAYLYRRKSSGRLATEIDCCVDSGGRVTVG